MNKYYTRNHIVAGASGMAAIAAAGIFWGLGRSTAVELYPSAADQELTKDSVVATESETASVPLPPVHLPTSSPVHAIYMTSWVAGTPSFRENLVEFARTSEINAIVIDVKDYTGKVAFKTGDAAIEALGSEENRIPDMRAFIDRLHKNNIYVIARISVFQDPHMASHRSDIAVERGDGSVWKDRKGISWIDPASKDMWAYIVRVARASEDVGFDELNFDYVRFPSDGNMNDMKFPVWDGITSRSDVLENFFAYLGTELSDLSVPISLDLFGMTMTNTDDLNIGQVLEKAALYADYIAPMVYPSHYPNGWNNLSNPAAYPYEVIHYAMTEGARRLEVMRELTASSTSPLYGKKIAQLRPWIQDFDLGADYTADMILKEKQAIHDVGLDSWMAWDPKNIYTKEAYENEL